MKISRPYCLTIFSIGNICQFKDHFCKWLHGAHVLIFDHIPQYRLLRLDAFAIECEYKKKSKRYANNQPNQKSIQQRIGWPGF